MSSAAFFHCLNLSSTGINIINIGAKIKFMLNLVEMVQKKYYLLITSINGNIGKKYHAISEDTIAGNYSSLWKSTDLAYINVTHGRICFEEIKDKNDI